MKKLIYLFLALGFFSVACNNTPETNNETDIDELKARVIAVHDTAMLQMNVLGKLASQLKERSESAQDSAVYMNVYQQTNDARQAMMNWMREFDIPKRSETTNDEVRAYLLEEEKKIEAVKKDMDKAREEAEKILFEKIAPDSTNVD